MTAIMHTRYWTGPRLFACAASAGVAILFIAANTHLVAVAFRSKPDCVLHLATEGSAALRAAKPSC